MKDLAVHERELIFLTFCSWHSGALTWRFLWSQILRLVDFFWVRFGFVGIFFLYCTTLMSREWQMLCMIVKYN